MGQILGTFRTKHLDLNMNDKPSFPPNAGFTFKRQPRGMIATTEELSSAKIPVEFRDFCAHLLIDYQVCRYKNFPLVYRCSHQKHAYMICEQEDYLMRMKEFERERRLREREIRIKKNPPPPPPK